MLQYTTPVGTKSNPFLNKQQGIHEIDYCPLNPGKLLVSFVYFGTILKFYKVF